MATIAHEVLINISPYVNASSLNSPSSLIKLLKFSIGSPFSLHGEVSSPTIVVWLLEVFGVDFIRPVVP